VRDCAPASRLGEAELTDHLPSVLSEAIDGIEAIAAGGWNLDARGATEAHAHVRLGEGLSLSDVTTELMLLRHLLMELAWDAGGPADRLGNLQTVGWAVDALLRRSVNAFVEERQHWERRRFAEEMSREVRERRRRGASATAEEL
jgi:hypothetical protein